MRTYTIARRSLFVSALAATAALAAPAVPALAAPVLPCASGYVCVAVAGGSIISVPEGQSQRFPGGVTMTGIANRTKIPYCVGGSPNFNLPSDAEIIRKQTVTGFAPGRYCLS